MGGGGDRRRAEEEARRRQQQADAVFAQATPPNPLADRLQQNDLNFLNTTAAPGFDVRNLNSDPEMNAALGQYNAAVNRRASDRMGTGLLRIGEQASNPNLVALYREQQEARDREAAGGTLANAYARRFGSIRGTAPTLAGLDQDRRMNLASLSANTAGNAWNRWTTISGRQPFWQQLALAGYQNAASAASAAGGGFARGGNWSRWLGQPVWTGEEGPELAVDDQGRSQVLGARGPEQVIPQRPATVIPNDTLRSAFDRMTGQGQGQSAGGMMTPADLITLPRLLRSAVRGGDGASRPALGPPNTTAGFNPNAPMLGAPTTATSAQGSTPALIARSLPAPTEQGPRLMQQSDTSALSAPRPSLNAPLDDNQGHDTGTDKPMLAPPLALPRREPTLETTGTVGTDLAAPKLLSPVPQVPDRTLDPMEAERNYLAYQRGRKPEDHNGRLRSIGLGLLRGYMAGGLPGLIGGGITGAVDPASDERVAQGRDVGQHAQNLGELYQQRKLETDYEGDVARTGLVKAQTADELAKPERERQRLEAETLARIFNDLDEFDPSSTDPNMQAFVARARAANVPLVKKDRNNPKSIHIAPDGRLVITDTRGNVEIGSDPATKQPYNFSKPPEIKSDDIPDTLFGLPSDEQIKDQARAAVASSTKGREIKPEILQREKYRNADGTANMGAIWDDIELGVIHPADVWQNFTDRDEQRLAAARNSTRGQYAERRRLVDEFKLRLKSHRPTTANAAPTPLPNLIRRFNELLALPAKERDAAIKGLYDTLPYLQIQ